MIRYNIHVDMLPLTQLTVRYLLVLHCIIYSVGFGDKVAGFKVILGLCMLEYLITVTCISLYYIINIRDVISTGTSSYTGRNGCTRKP